MANASYFFFPFFCGLLSLISGIVVRKMRVDGYDEHGAYIAAVSVFVVSNMAIIISLTILLIDLYSKRPTP